MNQIQWYPGHMAKAKKEVIEKLSQVDIIYELLDARAPFSSANPMLKDIIGDKPRLVVMNKIDLADPKTTERFMTYFASKGIPAAAVDSLNGSPLKAILAQTKKILAYLREKDIRKGLSPRPFRAMVVGIPNVGKSQFINSLAGKAKAKTGNIPGITKQQTYLKAGKELELLDNPGILWPKFEDRITGLNLALIGSIKEEIYQAEEVAVYGIRLMSENYPELLFARYGIKKDMADKDMVSEIGRVRGCLLPGGIIDRERAAKLFLNEFRNNRLGRISVERPDANV
ncbi:MAG TPA: ribosome biogenesis GTPase YlqF [Bacillota bacterium]|nr:ribosome biogenesis GTPase YlqF [Bacillota bacterium]HPQ62523.1 ribosome biogenesis GTPase YlqF [Bacillota bacterium]